MTISLVVTRHLAGVMIFTARRSAKSITSYNTSICQSLTLIRE